MQASLVSRKLIGGVDDQPLHALHWPWSQAFWAVGRVVAQASIRVVRLYRIEPVDCVDRELGLGGGVSVRFHALRLVSGMGLKSGGIPYKCRAAPRVPDKNGRRGGISLLASLLPLGYLACMFFRAPTSPSSPVRPCRTRSRVHSPRFCLALAAIAGSAEGAPGGRMAASGACS